MRKMTGGRKVMAEDAAIVGANEGGAEPPQMNFIQRLAGIYFEPRKTFVDIHRRGSWVGLFVIVACLAVGANYSLLARMDYETYMRKALQMSPFSRNMSEEQIQQILSRPPSPLQRFSGVILAPVGVMVVYLALAGIFLLIFVLLGAAVTYKNSLAVTVWSMAPPAIILSALVIVFIWVKDADSLDLNATNNVASNPGIALSEKDYPVLHTLLSSIDLFSLWTICLLSIGFSTASE